MLSNFIYIFAYDNVRWSPLDGFVQLIDDSLQHSFVGRDVWPMKTGSEEC